MSVYPSSREHWEEQRRSIEAKYLDRPLHQLRAEMREEHGFEATERQYKRRISYWYLDKNVKTDDMLAVVYALCARKSQGKDSAFFVKERRVDPKKIGRFIGRINPEKKAELEHYQLVCSESHEYADFAVQTLPSHIRCCTPTPDTETLQQPLHEERQIQSEEVDHDGPATGLLQAEIQTASQWDPTLRNSVKSTTRPNERLDDTNSNPEAEWLQWAANAAGCTIETFTACESLLARKPNPRRPVVEIDVAIPHDIENEEVIPIHILRPTDDANNGASGLNNHQLLSVSQMMIARRTSLKDASSSSSTYASSPKTRCHFRFNHAKWPHTCQCIDQSRGKLCDLTVPAEVVYQRNGLTAYGHGYSTWFSEKLRDLRPEKTFHTVTNHAEWPSSCQCQQPATGEPCDPSTPIHVGRLIHIDEAGPCSSGIRGHISKETTFSEEENWLRHMHLKSLEGVVSIMKTPTSGSPDSESLVLTWTWTCPHCPRMFEGARKMVYDARKYHLLYEHSTD